MTAADLPHLHAFTRGLAQDRDAVNAALTLPYHNGGTEGVNTKTKRIMPQMHGRASFDRTPDYEPWREDHLAAEQQLKDRDLIRTVNGPHRVEVRPDVLVSLRYRDLDNDHPGRYQPQPGESAGTQDGPDQDDLPGLAGPMILCRADSSSVPPDI